MLSKNNFTKKLISKVFIATLTLVFISLNVSAQQSGYDDSELYLLKKKLQQNVWGKSLSAYIGQ